MMGKKNISKDLLYTCENNRKEEIIKSLLDGKDVQPKVKPKIFKIERSSLFSDLNKFIPEIKTSNQLLKAIPKSTLETMDIENVDNCEKIIEMSLLIGQKDDNGMSSSDEDEESTKTSSEGTQIKKPLIEELPDSNLSIEIKSDSVLIPDSGYNR